MAELTQEQMQAFNQQLEQVKAAAWDMQQELMQANRLQQQQAAHLMQRLQVLAKVLQVPVTDGRLNLDELIQAAEQAMQSKAE